MEEKVEISVEILNEIFNLAKMEIPEQITDENLLSALFKLRNPENEKQKGINYEIHNTKIWIYEGFNSRNGNSI